MLSFLTSYISLTLLYLSIHHLASIPFPLSFPLKPVRKTQLEKPLVNDYPGIEEEIVRRILNQKLDISVVEYLVTAAPTIIPEELAQNLGLLIT